MGIYIFGGMLKGVQWGVSCCGGQSRCTGGSTTSGDELPVGRASEQTGRSCSSTQVWMGR